MHNEWDFFVWDDVVVYVGAGLPSEADFSLSGDLNGLLRIDHNHDS